MKHKNAVGCVLLACCPYLPACTAPRGCTWSQGGVPDPGLPGLGATCPGGVYLVLGGVPGLGGCTYPGGVPGPGEVYLVLGVPSPGGVPAQGVYLVPGGVPGPRGYLPRYSPPLWTDRHV